MKRKELVRLIVELGAVFVREGGGHSVYENPRTKRTLSVPRHAEINEHTAKSILRDAGR
jgi:predicted RNA binding protein YcfA (HicA-like mRNA interferase family)